MGLTWGMQLGLRVSLFVCGVQSLPLVVGCEQPQVVVSLSRFPGGFCPQHHALEKKLLQ